MPLLLFSLYILKIHFEYLLCKEGSLLVEGTQAQLDLPPLGITDPSCIEHVNQGPVTGNLGAPYAPLLGLIDPVPTMQMGPGNQAR